MGSQGDAVDGRARQNSATQDIERLLQVTDGAAAGVEIQGLVEQQWHGQVIAREDVPGTLGSATPQLGHVQVGDEAMAGQHLASICAGALERGVVVLGTRVLSVRFPFFH